MKKTPSRRAAAKPTPCGIRLRSLREAAGIDATQLSHVVGRSRTVVYQIEVGLIQYPSAALGLRLASALGTTLEWLLNGVGKEPTTLAVRRAFNKATKEQADQ